MNQIKKYYLYLFFSNLFFERNIFLLYLLYKGLNVAEIATYQAIINITMLAFEVVTGVVADRVGKKKSLIVGACLMIIYHIIMLSASDYYAFLISAVVFGIGYTFISGTDQSYIYDLVEDRSNTMIKYVGYFSSVVTIAIAVAGYLGGLIQNIEWSYIFILGILAQIISIAILIKLPNIRIKTNIQNVSNSAFSEVKTFVKLINKNSFIRYLSIFLAVNMGIVSAIYIFSQEMLLNYGFNVTEIAIFFTLEQAISAFVFSKVDKITQKIGVFTTLIVSMVLLFCAFTSITLYLLIPIAILCMSIFSNLMGIILENTFNINIPDSVRATSNSILNASSSVIMTISFLSVNLLQNTFSYVIGSLGVISVIALMIICIKFKNNIELDE